jgi:hypothetical protein
MRRACRGLVATVVAVAGVASIVATSPPFNWLSLEAHPPAVCRGAPVTLGWRLGGESMPPSTIRIVSVPADAFTPALTGGLPEREGEIEVTALAPAYIGVYQEHLGGQRLTWSAVAVDVADCAALGFQAATDELPLVAIAHDPSSGHLLAAVEPSPASAPGGLRRWSPELEPLATIELPGRITDLAASFDGRLGITGALPHADPDAAVPVAFAGVVEPDGTPLWLDLLEPPAGALDAESQGTAVAFAPDGGLVVAGWSSTGGPRQGFVRRHDATGRLIWEHTVAAGEAVEARAVAVREGGDVLVAGLTRARLTGDEDASGLAVFVRALDGASGAEAWTAQRPPASPLGGRPALARLSGDRVLLLALDLTAFGAAGEELWTRAPEPGHGYSALAEDGVGGVFVASNVKVEVPFPTVAYELRRRVDVLVERYDADGLQVRQHLLGSLGMDLVVGLTAWPAAGQDAVAVAGTTSGSLLTPVDDPVPRWSYLKVLAPER